MERITGILEAINSRRDRYGNCYWALRYTDVKTGKTVCGTVSGGESNINAIRRYWSGDYWDHSVKFETRELGIREFSRLTKDWAYAGCGPEDLAAFIKAKLAE